MMDRDFEDPFLRAAISSGGDMARVAARIAYRQMAALERQAAATEEIVSGLKRLEQMLRPPVMKTGSLRGADLSTMALGGYYEEAEMFLRQGLVNEAGRSVAQNAEARSSQEPT